MAETAPQTTYAGGYGKVRSPMSRPKKKKKAKKR